MLSEYNTAGPRGHHAKAIEGLVRFVSASGSK